MTLLTLNRRAVLIGSAAATCLAARPTRAAIVGTVAEGSNGWLFPTWDEIRTANLTEIDRSVATINAVVAQFKRGGIDLAISLTPAKARIYPQFLPADFQFSTAATGRYAHELEQLRGSGALVPDLATLFATLSQQPAPADSGGSSDFVPVGADLYFKADTHWTTMASLPAATEFANQIMTKLQLPASAKPGTALGDPTKTLQEQNDLASLLPAADQPRFPLESYMLPQTAQGASDTALIADDAADTVVVGNSYMQPKYGFAAMLSNKLGRPVGLTWKIDRFGPYSTLVNFLKSDQFRQAKPKLLVWNFRENHLEHQCSDDEFFGQNAMSAADLTHAVAAALT